MTGVLFIENFVFFREKNSINTHLLWKPLLPHASDLIKTTMKYKHTNRLN